MLKFLPGILLLQAITVALTVTMPSDMSGWWWRLLLPLVTIGVVTAFWLKSLADQHNKDEMYKLRETHAKEREQIRVNAERAKTRIVKEVQQETLQEVRKTSAQANTRLGIAVGGMAAIGGALMLAQFITMGLVVFGTAGGAVGGYIMRRRQEKGKSLIPGWTHNNAKLINATPTTQALPKMRKRKASSSDDNDLAN